MARGGQAGTSHAIRQGAGGVAAIGAIPIIRAIPTIHIIPAIRKEDSMRQTDKKSPARVLF